MEKVAFFWRGDYVYWHSVFHLLGAVTAVLAALALRLLQKKPLLPLLLAIAPAAAAGVYAGRLLHWYCRFESYESLRAALTQLRAGGFSLMGALGACVLALMLCCLPWLRQLPGLLDCAAPAAALGIAVGRLGELYGTANRGKLLVEDAAFHRLPYAAAVVNAVSGEQEWRFATFFAQSLWALALFAVFCLWLLLRSLRPADGEPESGGRQGDVFALCLTAYCLGQTVLDSTRYDALYLRSNGFVSLEQIVCAFVAVGVLVYYSCLAVSEKGFRAWQPLLWLLALGCLGGAGYMEYYVQRHGNAFFFSYGLMSASLLLFFVIVLLLRAAGARTGD